MNPIIKSLMMKFLNWGLNYLYNSIDSDNDGKLSKKELDESYEKFKSLMAKLRRKEAKK